MTRNQERSCDRRGSSGSRKIPGLSSRARFFRSNGAYRFGRVRNCLRPGSFSESRMRCPRLPKLEHWQPQNHVDMAPVLRKMQIEAEKGCGLRRAPSPEFCNERLFMGKSHCRLRRNRSDPYARRHFREAASRARCRAVLIPGDGIEPRGETRVDELTNTMMTIAICKCARKKP